jgi:hypothetical protein
MDGSDLVANRLLRRAKYALLAMTGSFRIELRSGELELLATNIKIKTGK